MFRRRASVIFGNAVATRVRLRSHSWHWSVRSKEASVELLRAFASLGKRTIDFQTRAAQTTSTQIPPDRWNVINAHYIFHIRAGLSENGRSSRQRATKPVSSQLRLTNRCHYRAECGLRFLWMVFTTARPSSCFSRQFLHTDIFRIETAPATSV